MNTLLKFIGKRIILAIGLTLAAVSVIFFTIRLIPGSPFTELLATGNVQPEQVEELKATWGLNQPIEVQYFQYMKSLLSLEWGFSLRTGQPVLDIIFTRLANSLILLFPALIFTAIMSTLVGFYAGWHRGSNVEKFAILFSTFFRSTPIFITGIFLLMIFSYGLGWFPIFGMRSPTAMPDSMIDRFASVDFLRHYVLPFTSAVLFYSGDFLLLARSGVVEKKGSEFLKLHKAKGLTENEQLFRAGRNSLLPIITYFAVRAGMIFQGLVLLEVVFAWPGVGRELVLAIVRQDYPVAQAAVFVMALAVIFSNLTADILYGYLDPTVRVGETDS